MPNPLRIFVVTYFLPMPDRNSADRRFCGILSHLAARHAVSIFAIETLDTTEARNTARGRLEGMGVSNVWEGRSLLPKVLLKARFDLLLAEFFYSGEFAIAPFRQANPGAAVMVDSVDLHYVREQAGVEVGAETAETAASTRRREIGIYQQADAVLTVTKEDDEIFRRDVAGVASVLVPNIVAMRPRARLERDPLLFFVGSFAHRPNIDGLLWFANEIWPAIKREVPAARVEIAGHHPPLEIQRLAELDGIAVLGHVPDTNPYLDRAFVSIAPLRFGGGMKGKVTEALASGVPVVTTSAGAQGFGALDRVHLRVADDAEDFARAVVEVLQNEEGAHEMGLRGQALVESICSPDVVEKKIDEAVSIAARRSRGGNPFHRAQFAVGALMEFGGRLLQRKAQRFMGYREV